MNAERDALLPHGGSGNGLLLTPSADHLFDRGFISFDDKGELLASRVAGWRVPNPPNGSRYPARLSSDSITGPMESAVGTTRCRAKPAIPKNRTASSAGSHVRFSAPLAQ
jgi:hypothetical protein